MMMLDNDEKRLHNLFSQIPVDTKTLERKVKENMNKNLRKAIKPTPRRKAGVLLIASLVVILFVAGTAYAMGQGIFDRFIIGQDTNFDNIVASSSDTTSVFNWFIANQNPNFADIVEPIEIITEVYGIRTNIIAAQYFAGTAVVYLSVQDVSGQNRLSEQSTIVLGACRVSSPSGTTGGAGMISFDMATNTAYFQARITTWDTSLDYMGLGSVCITFNGIQHDNSRTQHNNTISISISIPTSVRENVSTIPMPANHYRTMGLSPEIDARQWILAPAVAGQFAELPNSRGNQWISGIDIVDGYLHVQLGQHLQREQEYIVTRTSYPELTTPSGDVIMPWGTMVRFFTDDNLQPIPLAFLPSPEVLAAANNARMAGEIVEDPWVYNPDVANAPYMFTDIFFPINIDELELYSLNLISTFGADISVALELTIQQGNDRYIRTIYNPVSVNGNTIESVTITPLGVSFTGNIGANFLVGNNVVLLETTSGTFNAGTVLSAGDDNTFTSFVNVESPLDVNSVIAVIIDGVHFEFK